MRRDLPTSEQIVEELADKVALQIDRSAPVAFERALEEMERYHRFLMAVHAVVDAEGRSGSWAEIDAARFRPAHAEWVTQYGRLFERAVDRMASDPVFIRRLSYVPLSLLPRVGEAKLSPRLVEGILDLGPMLVGRLQTWVTRHASPGAAMDEGASDRPGPRGADAQAYEDVVDGFVGAWEQLPHRGTNLPRADTASRESDGERWQACRGAWSFLWRHLVNTALCLVACVRNEDEVGVAAFTDAFLRWPETMQSPLDDEMDLGDPRLLFPDVLALDWVDALARLRPMLLGATPVPIPERVLASLIRTSHADVRLITSSLLVSWSSRGKRAGRFASETAAALLKPRAFDDDDLGRDRPYAFRPRMMDVLRLRVVRDGFGRRDYAGDLDRLVTVLDQTTERRVVPGRSFVPTTLSHLGDLDPAMLSILLAVVPGEGDDEIRRRVGEWATDEDGLPDGDACLRELLDGVARLRRLLENAPSSIEAARNLAPHVDAEAAVGALNGILCDVITVVSDTRVARLAGRPLSQAKLDLIRDAVSTALLSPRRGIAHFVGFAVRSAPKPPRDGNVRDVGRDVTIERGRLVEPPMLPPDPDLSGRIARTVADHAVNGVLRSFRERNRIRHEARAGVDEAEFWNDVAMLARQVGDRPVLILSGRAEASTLRRLMRLRPRDAGAMGLVVIDPDRARDYVATVGRLDVFGGDQAPGRALLFSARLLRDVTYVRADGTASPVSLEVTSSDVANVGISLRCRQVVTWRDGPVFEIVMTDADGDGTGAEAPPG